MATPVRTAEEKKPQMRLLIAVLIVCLLLSLLVDGRKKCKKRRRLKEMPHPYYKQSFKMSPIFQIYICVKTLHESALTSQFWSVVVSVMGSLMMPVMGLVTRWVIGSIMDCHGVGLEVM